MTNATKDMAIQYKIVFFEGYTEIPEVTLHTIPLTVRDHLSFLRFPILLPHTEHWRKLRLTRFPARCLYSVSCVVTHMPRPSITEPPSCRENVRKKLVISVETSTCGTCLLQYFKKIRDIKFCVFDFDSFCFFNFFVCLPTTNRGNVAIRKKVVFLVILQGILKKLFKISENLVLQNQYMLWRNFPIVRYLLQCLCNAFDSRTTFSENQGPSKNANLKRSTTQKSGFINWVDIVSWPPWRT